MMIESEITTRGLQYPTFAKKETIALKLKKLCKLRLVKLLLLAVGVLSCANLSAEVVADWGSLVTPLEQDVTFSFEQYDIEKNFTDDYLFSLDGGANAVYEVAFNVDYCRVGCGNVVLSYGVYNASGGLVTLVEQDGSVLLAAGDYSFQVIGTGFGANNSVDYFGNITFSSAASPAPEPPAYALMILGAIISYVLYRRNRRPKTHARQRKMNTGLKRVLMLASMSAALGGCFSDSGSTGQRLATINGEHLTQFQYQHLLEQTANSREAQSQPEKVAKKMIDQQLAIQQAETLELDRRPDVMIRLELAKREILAGAYAEYITQAVPSPTQEEIAAFYAAHPHLFELRKIYHLQTLKLPGALRESELFADLIRKGASVKELITWLSEQSQSYTLATEIRASESLPTGILPTLATADKGTSNLFDTGSEIWVYVVKSSEAAPIKRDQAYARIDNHLRSLAERQALVKAIEHEKAKSQIALFGDFETLLGNRL